MKKIEPPKTMSELYECLLNTIPNATLGDDNDGQVIIYTNLRLLKNGKLVEMK